MRLEAALVLLKTVVERGLECLEVGLVNGPKIKVGHAKVCEPKPMSKVKAPLISPYSSGALTSGPKVHKPIGVKLTRPSFLERGGGLS